MTKKYAHTVDKLISDYMEKIVERYKSSPTSVVQLKTGELTSNHSINCTSNKIH